MSKGRFTVTNTRTMGQTARSTLGSILGWGMAAVVIYGGWNVWQWVKSERPYLKNEQRVVEAINQREYDRAQALLAEYRTGDFLRPEQRIDLEQRLQGVQAQETRLANLSRIDALIAAADIPSAQTQLQQLVGSGEYTAEQLEPYRVKVLEYTEAGLFQSIQQRPKDRELLIPRYLQLYPNGEHQSVVVQYALTDGVNALADALSSRADFDTVYGKLSKLNIFIDSHVQAGTSAVSVLSASELRKALDQYEQSYVRLEGNAKPAFDTLVKVVPTPDPYGLNGQFVVERNFNFPPGTLGTVMDTRKRGDSTSYLVRFTGQQPQWSPGKAEDWDMEDYWRRDPAIAEYLESELRVATRLTNAEKGQLRLEVNRFASHLSRILPQSTPAIPYGVNATP